MAIWHIVCGMGWDPAYQVLCSMCTFDKSKSWSKQDLTWIDLQSTISLGTNFLDGDRVESSGDYLKHTCGRYLNVFSCKSAELGQNFAEDNALCMLLTSFF